MKKEADKHAAEAGTGSKFLGTGSRKVKPPPAFAEQQPKVGAIWHFVKGFSEKKIYTRTVYV